MRSLTFALAGSFLFAVGCSANGVSVTPAACGVATGTFCGTFTAFPVSDAAPHGIVYNPSGTLSGLWYTNATLDPTSGVVAFLDPGPSQRYLTPTPGARPGSINIAPDSSLWFTETATGKIATIGAARAVAEFTIPTRNGRPLDITRGPDGAMWFTESAVGKIGRVTSAGAITEYQSGGAASEPTAIITGPDNALWFTETGSGQIGRFTLSGSLQQFSAGPQLMTGDITFGTDGALWFAQASSVGRMTTDGTLTEFALPGVITTGAIFGSKYGGVFVGAMKANGMGALVSLNPAGTTREYDLPQPNLLPIELAETPDGAFWMTVQATEPGVSDSVLFELR